MIGTSLALALAPLRLRVAVVEPVMRNDDLQPSFDDRSTALSRSTQRMFGAMGVWPDVAAAATPIRHIHVSDKGRFGFAHIDAEEQRVEALGHVVINRVLGDVLHTRISDVPDLTWLSPARIEKIHATGDRCIAVIAADSGEIEYSCRLIIAADGAASTVRDLLGIGAIRKDYAQTAIIGNLMPENDIDNVAYERFTGSGALAMLPIADNRAAFVWILETSLAAGMLALGDEDFTVSLHHAFGNRLGGFSRIGRRAAYPLSLSKANSLTASRAVIVGNAAHGLHPVAAQGFNLGMRDVATLCDCLLEEKARSERNGNVFDPGSPLLLERYAEWRKHDQRKLVGFTDGLIRLFGDPRSPVAALRDVGMIGFDLLPGVRRTFARHTMGLEGRLPRLSRGVSLK